MPHATVCPAFRSSAFTIARARRTLVFSGLSVVLGLALAMGSGVVYAQAPIVPVAPGVAAGPMPAPVAASTTVAVPDGAEGRVHVCGQPRPVTWTPLVSAAISSTQRDDLWQESNLHGYLGPCDTLTLLPGLDQIQALLEDPAHEDQLRCLWDLGMLAEAGTNPPRDPASGRAILVTPAKRQAVLDECQAAAAAHQDGYLNDQVRALARTFTPGTAP